MSIDVNENKVKIITENNLKIIQKNVSSEDVINFENEMDKNIKVIESTKHEMKSNQSNYSALDFDKFVKKFVDDVIAINPQSIIEIRDILDDYKLNIKEKQSLILSTLKELNNNTEVSEFVVSLIERELSLLILKDGMINNMLTKTIKPDLD